VKLCAACARWRNDVWLRWVQVCCPGLIYWSMVSLVRCVFRCWLALVRAWLEKWFADLAKNLTRGATAPLLMPAESQGSCREVQLRVPTKPWKLIEPLFTFRADTTDCRDSSKI
jgi:hypothetical protein